MSMARLVITAVVVEGCFESAVAREGLPAEVLTAVAVPTPERITEPR